MMQTESFGEYIKSQRELRNVSYEEVTSVTKVSTRYLDALEKDKKESLPAKPFVVGFLRVYSNFLGLDDDAVVTRYLSLSDDPQESYLAGTKPAKKKKVRIFLASSAALLALASILYISFL